MICDGLSEPYKINRAGVTIASPATDPNPGYPAGAGQGWLEGIGSVGIATRAAVGRHWLGSLARSVLRGPGEVVMQVAVEEQDIEQAAAIARAGHLPAQTPFALLLGHAA